MLGSPDRGLRFTLSYRDVEDLLAERGLDVSYETVRRWVLKFGPAVAQRLRHCRQKVRRRLCLVIPQAPILVDNLAQSSLLTRQATKLSSASPLIGHSILARRRCYNNLIGLLRTAKGGTVGQRLRAKEGRWLLLRSSS